VRQTLCKQGTSRKLLDEYWRREVRYVESERKDGNNISPDAKTLAGSIGRSSFAGLISRVC
jgi:hypothetical protein